MWALGFSPLSELWPKQSSALGTQLAVIQRFTSPQSSSIAVHGFLLCETQWGHFVCKHQLNARKCINQSLRRLPDTVLMEWISDSAVKRSIVQLYRTRIPQYSCGSEKREKSPCLRYPAPLIPGPDGCFFALSVNFKHLFVWTHWRWISWFRLKPKWTFLTSPC